MKVVNKTPFAFQPLPSTVNPPQRSLTLILKGTFTLNHQGVVTLDKEQLPISTDKPFLDDIGRSLAWATDLAPFKPHTDFYVIGTFHQPGGVPASRGEAGFTLGPLQKSVVIHGPRLAVRHPDLTWVITHGEPIASLALRWEYSFGGLSDRRNPMGMGIDPIETADGSRVIRLPMIEDPLHPLTNLNERPAPANLAPVPPSFQSRRVKMGTRDRRWAVFRAPLPPRDYDPSFHNAAPDDQQAGNYPLGNEALTLTNLHPTTPTLVTQLPGLRPRIGVLRKTAAGISADEVPINLDTIVAMPDQDRLVLVWRGVTDVQTAFLPDEILLFQCEMEPLDGPATVPSLPDRMLAEYLGAKDAEEARNNAAVAQAYGEMYKLLAKANLPADLMTAIKAEPDPTAVFKMLDTYVTAAMQGLKQKFPDILPDLPP